MIQTKIENAIHTLNASEIYKKYGVSKNRLHSILLNVFHFPAQYYDTLDIYYILHWEGKYLSNRTCDGILSVKGINYMIVYDGCTPHQVHKAKELRLSFRKCVDEINLPAYVNIRILTESNES